MKESRKILITGGRGFVGSHLQNHLARKGFNIVDAQFNGYERKTSLDVTRLHQLLTISDSIDAIIHLAAKTSISKSFLSPYETYYTNLLGTLNLLEFARQKKVSKFIFVSTYVYGEPLYLPIDEKHPMNAHSPYTASKIMAEKLCESYSNDFNIDIVVLRPFYLYGPNTRTNSLIDYILKQISNGGREEVRLSIQLAKRDFLYIGDFLELIEVILESFPKRYNLYNVGYGKSYALSEVCQTLARILNKKIHIRNTNEKKPGDVTDMVADISKICNQFNWKPSTDLDKGLKKTVKQ